MFIWTFINEKYIILWALFTFLWRSCFEPLVCLSVTKAFMSEIIQFIDKLNMVKTTIIDFHINVKVSSSLNRLLDYIDYLWKIQLEAVGNVGVESTFFNPKNILLNIDICWSYNSELWSGLIKLLVSFVESSSEPNSCNKKKIITTEKNQNCSSHLTLFSYGPFEPFAVPMVPD